MQAEIHCIHKNDTWELVEQIEGQTIISAKWVFKIENFTGGRPPFFKARLVTKGYEHNYGIDFDEAFAPVIKWNTLTAVIGIIASKGWKQDNLTSRLHSAQYPQTP